MRRQSDPHGGFTLIEVLVALVIVAVSMTAAILVVTQRTRDGTYLRDKTVAHWIAMNLITERRLQAAAPAVGKSSDSLEYGGTQWRWTVDVKETAVESMRRMDVSVRQADAPEDSALATVTGFYGTSVAGAIGSPTHWEFSAAGPGGVDDGTNDQANGGTQGTQQGGPGSSSGNVTGGNTSGENQDNQDTTEQPVTPEPGEPQENTQ